MVGGRAAADAEFMECCGVGVRRDPNWIGSGALIASRVAVTAAHNHGSDAVAFGNDLHAAPGRIVDARCVANPRFRFGRLKNDIAVMLLRDVPCGIRPVVRATTREMSSASRVTLAGFGRCACARANSAGMKRVVEVPIQFMKGGRRTAISEKTSQLFDHDTEFLAGEEGGGACLRDSGGPAYIWIGGQQKLAGVIVRDGQPGLRQCSGLTVITRIDVWKHFLDEQAADFSGCFESSASGTGDVSV